jgi:hypothetical protein
MKKTRGQKSRATVPLRKRRGFFYIERLKNSPELVDIE